MTVKSAETCLTIALAALPGIASPRGRMSLVRRSRCRLGGAIVVAIVMMSQHMAAAGPPVHEVQVVADKFAFDPATIHVTSGEPVRLVIRSKDTVHGFSIPKLNIDVRIPKGGESMVVEFVAPSPGRFEIACSEFCGGGHGKMKAALISVAPVTTSR
jgi:cytochrome c oxidase subunit 2